MAQLIARVVWDHQAAGLSPVAPTILGFGICFPKPFSLFSPIQLLRADRSDFCQPSVYSFLIDKLEFDYPYPKLFSTTPGRQS